MSAFTPIERCFKVWNLRIRKDQFLSFVARPSTVVFLVIICKYVFFWPRQPKNEPIWDDTKKNTENHYIIDALA